MFKLCDSYVVTYTIIVGNRKVKFNSEKSNCLFKKKSFCTSVNMHPEWSTKSLFVKNSKILISSFFIVKTLQSKKPYENGPVSNIVYIGASIPPLEILSSPHFFWKLSKRFTPTQQKGGWGWGQTKPSQSMSSHA